MTTTIDFHEFHRNELPARLAAGNGALAVDDARQIGPLAIRTPEGAYAFVPEGDTIRVVEGDKEATTVVALDRESWQGLVSDLDTAPGLLYGGRVEVLRGNPLRFVRWEPALRAMFHGRPIHDPDTVDLRDRAGEPLDPAESFTLDDVTERAADVRHFLETAGYVLVRDVFSEAETTGFREEADVLEREAEQGDQESWWGKDGDGEPVLCRVLRAATKPRLGALPTDPRVRAISAISPHELVSKGNLGRDSVTVLWKRPGVVEGLADLPWHRDCGMGGHALNCPGMVMTICLTDGSAEAGELRALPGSHTGSFPFVDGTDVKAPRGVSLALTRGDVSLHYTDLMHASMAPTSEQGPHRIAALIGFSPPQGGHHRGERHYNDVLLGAQDGQVKHLADEVGARG